RRGRSHPPGAAGARHRCQGRSCRHDVGACLMATATLPPLGEDAPPYWQDACRHLMRRDRVMKKLIPAHAGAYLQSRGDAFVTLARSIVGQQISVKAAQSVWDRFEKLPRKMTPAQV